MRQTSMLSADPQAQAWSASEQSYVQKLVELEKQVPASESTESAWHTLGRRNMQAHQEQGVMRGILHPTKSRVGISETCEKSCLDAS